MCENIDVCTEKFNRMYSEHYERFIEMGEKKFEQFIEDAGGSYKVIYTNHVEKRMVERCINENEVLSALENGWFIKSFPNEALILSYTKVGQSYRPIHVAIGYVNGVVSILTAYRPDHFEDMWDENYEKQICFCEDKKKGMY